MCSMITQPRSLSIHTESRPLALPLALALAMAMAMLSPVPALLLGRAHDMHRECIGSTLYWAARSLGTKKP